VVFGGFAAASLAARLDDARRSSVHRRRRQPHGKGGDYKALVDESIRLAKHPPGKVVIFRRGLDPSMKMVPGPTRAANPRIPAEWIAPILAQARMTTPLPYLWQ